jgi:ketosteroid isomerase-like protein
MAQHDHQSLMDVESSEEMTSSNVRVQRFGLLKKTALAAAVGALVVVGVNHIQPSGSLSPPQADTGAITNQAEMDANSAVVAQVMGDWGKGLYHGAACKATAEKMFTKDFVADASGNNMKNTDIFKKYHGIDGLCEWVANLEQMDFKGFKIESMLPSGDNEVILQTINTPKVKATGKTAEHPMHDMQKWTVTDGKVSATKFYFGDAAEMDALFAKNDAVAIVGNVMGGWGKGLYHGAACKATAEKTFTKDFVADASGYDMKNTDIFKKYHGIDGLCEWVANLEQMEFKGFAIDSMTPIGDNEVILEVSSTPKVIATGKEPDHPVHDIQRWTVKDGKVSATKFFFSDAVAMDARFAK